MRLSVLMGVERFWVRCDAEFDEEQVTGPLDIEAFLSGPSDFGESLSLGYLDENG